MFVGVTTIGKGVGATTVAAGLASALSDLGESSSTLLVESDVAGGDLARIRGIDVAGGGVLGWVSGFGIDAESGLADQVWSHRSVPRCAVLVNSSAGPVEALEQLWRHGVDEMNEFADFVVADFGRWNPTAQRWWAQMHCGVVVASGSVAGLERAIATAGSGPLASSQRPVCAVVNGSGFGVDEIRETTGMDWQDCFEWSRRDAERIRLGEWKRARRSQLGRQLAAIAAAIDTERRRDRSTDEAQGRGAGSSSRGSG